MSGNQELLLFRLIQRGNKGAFETFFRAYYEPVSHFVYRFVKDADSAEEVTQDLFIHLWENAPRMHITSSVKAYLFISARNFSLNFIKKNKTRNKYHDEAMQEDLDNEGILDGEQKKVFSKLMKQALTTLPEKCREIFELSKFEGLNYTEISDYLGISKKTVENQIGIALRKIREWMKLNASELYD